MSLAEEASREAETHGTSCVQFVRTTSRLPGAWYLKAAMKPYSVVENSSLPPAMHHVESTAALERKSPCVSSAGMLQSKPLNGFTAAASSSRNDPTCAVCSGVSARPPAFALEGALTFASKLFSCSSKNFLISSSVVAAFHRSTHHAFLSNNGRLGCGFMVTKSSGETIERTCLTLLLVKIELFSGSGSLQRLARSPQAF